MKLRNFFCWENLLIILITTATIYYLSPYALGLLVGNSMQPTIDSCSLTLYNEEAQPEQNDIVRFQYQDNKTLTHRIININQGRITTKGDNNQLPEVPFNKSNIEGVLVWHSPSIGSFCSTAFNTQI